MLPEALVGSYQRYKEDTNVFTSALLQIAREFGYRPTENSMRKPAPQQSHQSHQPRLKGKARKLAQAQIDRESAADKNKAQNKTYKVSTKELLAQTEYVASHWDKHASDASKSILRSVLSCGQRAIASRRRCMNWFGNMEAKDHASDLAHQAFINSLEHMLNVLGGLQLGSLDPTTPSGSKDQASLKESSIKNRFASLTVEDPVEPKSSKSKSPKTASQKTEFIPTSSDVDLEIEDDLELAFATFCFFEDLHTIQEYLRSLWSRYKDRKIDLVTASLVSNAAIYWIGLAEANIHTSFPQKFTSTSGWEDLISTISPPPTITPEDSANFPGVSHLGKHQDQLFCFGRQGDASSVRGKGRSTLMDTFNLTQGEFNPLLYFETASVLMLYCSHIPNGARHEVAFLPKLRSEVLLPGVRMESLIAKKQAEVELLNKMLLDAGFWDGLRVGIYCSAISWFKKPSEPEMEKKNFIPWGQGDEFTNSCRALWNKRVVTAQNVVAAEIVLDFHKNNFLMASRTSMPLEDLFKEQARVKREVWDFAPSESMDHKLNFKFKIGSNTVQKTLHDDMFLGSRGNPAFEYREVVGNVFQEPTVKDYVVLDPDPNFYLRHNPIFCGSALLQLKVQAEEARVYVADKHKSILVSAHLYNALRQFDLCPRWPEMDRAIDEQMGPLFAGELPTDLTSMRTRVMERLGLGDRLTKNVEVWKRRHMKPSMLTQVFNPYLAGKQSLGFTIMQLMKNTWTYTGRGSKAGDSGSIVWPEFLSQLEKKISSLVNDPSIDYLALTLKCNEFLKRLEEARPPVMAAKLRYCFDAASAEKFPFLVTGMMASYVFLEEIIITEAGKPGTKIPPTHHVLNTDTGLKPTAQVFNDFFAKELDLN
ncbi:MAG: hypothetical protein M1820_002913 [Bogoriella megaspora]|nr:MAG: hypothetical protein M1820_002913 [Bogoriella megaspora]